MKERHWLTDNNSTTSTFIIIYCHQQSESKPWEAISVCRLSTRLLSDVQHFRNQSLSVLRFFVQNYNIFPIELVVLFQSVISYDWMCGCSTEYDSCVQLFCLPVCSSHVARIAIFATDLVHHIRFLFMRKDIALQWWDTFESLCLAKDT